MPAAFSTHSTASCLSQKYSRIHVAIMSRAETVELLLQIFSCRLQVECCQRVSGYCCRSVDSRDLGAAARTLYRIPVCTRWEMPEAMLITATRFGLKHCRAKNSKADCDNSTEEKDPGIIRISKSGAFSNEFCLKSQTKCIDEVGFGANGGMDRG